MSYRVVLQGRAAPGFDLSEVKRRFMTLTGQSEDTTQHLFRGSPTVIKRQVSQAEAERFARALTDIGAPTHIELEVPPALELSLDDEIFQPKRASTVTSTFAPPARAFAPNSNPLSPSLETMYRAVIGPKNTDFYLRYFARRDAGGSFLSWNWPVAFVQFWWSLYRKLWGFAFGGLALSVLFGMVGGFMFGLITVIFGHPDKATLETGGRIVGGIAGMFIAAFANGFYHRKVKRLITESAHINDPNQRLTHLAQRGGTSKASTWIAAAIFAIALLGILAAIAIPQYQDYAKRAALAEPRVQDSASREASGPTANSPEVASSAQPSGVSTNSRAPSIQEMTIVRIGHAGPLTGGIAHLGKDDENGVRLALEEANAKRLTIRGKVIRFELISVDDQADPMLAATVARRLVDAGVVGVAGHLNSGVTIPASAVYNRAGIPVISGSATNPRLTEQGFEVVFRTIGRDDQQGPAIATYIANILMAKRVAIVDDRTAYGEGLANDVEKALKMRGIQVVAREKTNDRATDFRAILTKMSDRNPDAIFYGGMDAVGGPMIKQARELGVKATFAFGDGACTSEMSRLGGAASEGMYCSQAGIPTQMASKVFQDAFRARFGNVLQYAPFFYDATNVLIAAMQRANSTDPATFLPALAQMSYDGATGHIEFDAKGDRKDAEMTIFQMRNGNVVPVAIVKAGKTTPIEFR